MSSVITIDARAIGRKRPILADFSIPYPPDLRDGGDHLTLRDLISRIVRAEVEAFRDRQEERRLARVLAPSEIEEGVKKGKVDAGGQGLRQTVDEDAAVATALQAFEDGIYIVFLDGDQQEHLDHQIFLKPGSRVSFVRLVMLAGG